MSKSNIIVDKSFDFSLRIVKLYRYLNESKHEEILSKQILRSGTSIGANINEAVNGQSKKDFIAKIHIAYKESKETEYWIKLLERSGILESNLAASLLNDCEELSKIMSKILTTSKNQ